MVGSLSDYLLYFLFHGKFLQISYISQIKITKIQKFSDFYYNKGYNITKDDKEERKWNHIK